MTTPRRRSLRARLAERRARDGDGRPLAPFRWWQVLTRSQLSLEIPDAADTMRTYTVDVRHLGDAGDGEVRARLFRDRALASVSRLPARFAVPGGHIEVATGTFGLKRCRFIPTDGAARQLTPHPRSAEGRRAALDREHPRASRVLGLLSLIVVVAGICLTVPQLVETVSQIPPIADTLGTFTAPIHLPPALNAGVTVLVGLASVERALRLRSSWLDDLAG
ncbi:hypothetical protein ACIPVB_05450 [Microbacterium sp. NPDC090007]|uniref:hypothetical protein n=1 Tax=Microbacterium sp. NPDC090007 TaxID=3364204 RepID=UPI0037FCE1EC